MGALPEGRFPESCLPENFLARGPERFVVRRSRLTDQNPLKKVLAGLPGTEAPVRPKTLASGGDPLEANHPAEP